MTDLQVEADSDVTILDVLGVDLCRDGILDQVPIRDLVRSERVCRRWQRAVLDYLPRCHNLTLQASQHYEEPLILSRVPEYHRTINIYGYDIFSVRHLFEKLGPLIVSLSTDRSDDEFYELIPSYCPRLRQIELKNIVICEQKLGKAFQNIELEKIKFIDRYKTVDVGKSLQLMNLNKLETLSMHSSHFRAHQLESINACNLWNVTTLELSSKYCSGDSLVVLSNMPKLESLTYRGSFVEDELVKYCSRLKHLKSIHLIAVSDDYVEFDYADGEFLEGIAKKCDKLEYLNIPGSLYSPYGRGLADLILKPSPGTSLCFTGVRIEDEKALLEYLKPLNDELKARGRMTITQEMLNEAFKSKGQKNLLVLSLAYPAPRYSKLYPELKIVLNVFRVCFGCSSKKM